MDFWWAQFATFLLLLFPKCCVFDCVCVPLFVCVFACFAELGLVRVGCLCVPLFVWCVSVAGADRWLLIVAGGVGGDIGGWL